MKAFRRKQSMYVAEVDDVEKRILSGIFADTALLLGTDLRGSPVGEGREPSAEEMLADSLREMPQEIGEPLDPALARLLPNAYEDEEFAREFRRLTEADIRATKVARLRSWVNALRAPGMELYVPVAEAGQWAAAITDVRLVLATRLQIETAADADEVYSRTGPAGETEEDYAQFALGQVYSALTWLQEALLAVMMSGR